MASYQTITNAQRLKVNWDDPTAWVGGVVPNALDADVTLTGISFVRTYEPVVATIQPGESFVVRSLTDGGVIVNGTLAVTGVMATAATLAGGTLNINGSSQSIIGSGTVTVAGAVSVPNIRGITDSGLASPGIIQSSGGALSITAVTLNNASLLYADGAPLTITVTGGPGAFRQLSGDMLVSSGVPILNAGYGLSFTGTYQAANGGTLSLNAGGTIANDGALIIFGSTTEAAGSAVDVIQTYDPVTGQYQPLQATLRAVTGELDIYGSQSFAAINSLMISGRVGLVGGTLGMPSLTVAAGGSLSGSGTVNGPVTDDGTITSSGIGGRLVLTGPVSGSGKIAVGYGSTLELGGAASMPVVFQSGPGALQLDSPASFTGIIQVAPGPATSASTLILQGVALASVTGYSYAGTASGGTLTIQEGATQQTLNFAGNLSTASFALSGGSNLGVTVTPLPTAPSLSLLSGSRAVSGFITNTNALTVGSSTTAGVAVAVAVGGTTATASVSATDVSGRLYTAVVSPALTPGLQQLGATVTATNPAGSVQTMTALNVDLLPAPINGITTADYSSFDLKTLLNEDFAYSFAAGTQALQLTNGTLSIGTGTTQALVEKLYSALLHRPGDPGGIGNFASQIVHGTSVGTVAQALLDSPEGRYFAMGTEPASTFVLQMYHSFLNRDPSAAEQAHYVNTINSGVTRGQVAAIFATSPEAARFDAAVPQYYSHIWSLDPQGALTTQLYETALGRDPELSAVQAWQDQLLAGLTPQAMAQIIASSSEFQADHNGQSPAAFVTSLYQSGLGRTPGAGEVQGWVNQIQAGAAPAAVTYGIATSAEATVHLSPAL